MTGQLKKSIQPSQTFISLRRVARLLRFPAWSTRLESSSACLEQLRTFKLIDAAVTPSETKAGTVSGTSVPIGVVPGVNGAAYIWL